MDSEPERPCENEVDAEAGAHLEAGDEATDLGHTEGNWDECAGSSAPFAGRVRPASPPGRRAPASTEGCAGTSRASCAPRSRPARPPAWPSRSTPRPASADRRSGPAPPDWWRPGRTRRNTPSRWAWRSCGAPAASGRLLQAEQPEPRPVVQTLALRPGTQAAP